MACSGYLSNQFKKVTGFKVATLDANHMNADDIMKNSIFDADQITVEEKESLFARHRLDLIELISVFKENFY